MPYIDVLNRTARVEHEATTSKVSEDQMFYCRQRGLSAEDALSLIVNGFARQVLKELPMEFAVEAQKLLAISLEGSVGYEERKCWSSTIFMRSRIFRRRSRDPERRLADG